MKSTKNLVIIISAIPAAIPGLYWQILDPLLGIHTFGTEFINSPMQMLMKGLPSTLLAWLTIYLIYKKLYNFFDNKKAKQAERFALNAVLVFLLANIGFVVNYIFAELISIFFNWTTVEYADLFGGIVLMAIYGYVPAIVCAILFFIIAITIQSHFRRDNRET